MALTTINRPDNQKALFGTGNDLEIYHGGTNSYIDNNTGALEITANSFFVNNAANNEVQIKATADGAVELYHNNSKKIETTSGGVSFSAHTYHADNQRAYFGAGYDLEIYHNSSSGASYITEANALLRIASDGIGIESEDHSEWYLSATKNNGVLLAYDNVQKFETTSAGILVTGTLAAKGQVTASAVPPIAIESTVDSNDFSISQYEDSNGVYTFIGQNSQLNAGGSDVVLDSGHKSAGIMLDARGNGAFYVYTGDTNESKERLKVDADGMHMVCSTSHALSTATTVGSGTSNYVYRGHHSATDGDPNTGTLCFTVWANGNTENLNNSYGATSDIKLKENIVDANSQWNDIKALKIRNYNFKAETGHDTHTQIGLVAQELETVCPKLVYETTDFNDKGEDLGTTTKAINYSVLYVKALKTLQEAISEIEILKTKVAALEAA